jgi:O-antigen/teichoic acid export membrane protein
MVLGTGFSMLASFGAEVIASRVLGPKNYGIYGLVISNVAVVGGALSPGISGAMAAFVAERDAKNDDKEPLPIIYAGISIEIVLSFFLISICMIFEQSLTNRFFNGSTTLTFFFVATAILNGFYGMIAGCIQGFRELKILAIARVLQRVSLLLMFLVTRGLFLGTTPALSMNMVSIMLPLSVCFGGVFLSLHHREIKPVFGERLLKQIQDGFRDIPSIVRFAVPVSIAATVTSFIQSSGPAIINYLSNGNPGPHLGFLVVILTLARPFNRLVQTTIRSAFPYLVHWNAKGSLQKTKRYAVLATLAVVVGYALLGLIVMFLGRSVILLIYGPDYVDVTRYLPWAILTFVTISLQDIYRVLVFSVKKTVLFLVVNVLSLGVFGLSIFLGKALFHTDDFIMLQLFSMGAANLTVAIGAVLLFLKRVKYAGYFE